MTKSEVVNEICKKTGVDKAEALQCVEAFMEVVKESLIKEENVYLRGFGSFILRREHKRLLAISQRTLLSLFLSTTSPHSSPQRSLQ